ncbi:MAG: SIS domain-containing protein [Pseudomonadota bacterium]
MTHKFFTDYAQRLQAVISQYDWSAVEVLAAAMREAWTEGRQVFLCGNGGSAANAMHIANDLLYGIDMKGAGIRVTALPSNSSVVTCLANDLGYDEIFSRQLKVHGSKGDLLVVLSGSGNSPNVVKALEQAHQLGMKSFAVLGYAGGKCLRIAQVPIHFPVDDMQICEDLQLIVGHMLMQWLCANPANNGADGND